MPQDMAPVPKESSTADKCFDAYSPFNVTHFGKLVGISQETQVFATPPRDHCVVIDNATNALAVVRRTPLTKYRTGLPPITRSGEAAADFHDRHLQQLGYYGLTPWITAVRHGSYDNSLYVQQELLPEDAEVEIEDDESCQIIQTRVEAYMAWVLRNNEPAFLSDISRPDQYSRIGDTVVLHDVEPLYQANK